MWNIPATGAPNGTQTPVDSYDFGSGSSDKTISCRWGPNGDIINSNNKKEIKMFKPGTPNTHVNMATLSSSALEMDFFKLSSTALIATLDGKVQQNTSSPFFTESSSVQVNSISIGKNGNYTVFGGASKILYIYDQAATPNLIAKFPNFATNINSVRISKNEDIIIVGTFGG